MTDNLVQPGSLADETSPYLLQHADNPVAWRPWNRQTLALARETDKPILLSIGYSACHWCHVMAHESFEDDATAALMNRYFINIKVDREERPDLDKIYQNAQQMLTGRPGGWPLTMFLMPEDQTPFFGGTYFPPEPRHGLPDFKSLLTRIHQLYQEDKPALQAQNAEFLKMLEQSQIRAGAEAPTRLHNAPVEHCVEQLADIFDRRNGGFGGAPKFPQPGNMELLFSAQPGTGQTGNAQTTRGDTQGVADSSPADMAFFTLEKMAQGGIYDQIGGGFYRYSVDAHWGIPHFEKMLYDNGPLLALYANAWHSQRQELFRQVAQDTAEWSIREMQAADGGFYSSLDADSEGEEGKFYIWEPDEAKRLLSQAEFDDFAPYTGLDQPDNFAGRWHLYVAQTPAALARSSGRSAAAVSQNLRHAAHKLYQARAQRPWPGRDDKILTSWNALMIKGLSVAARRLHRPEYYRAAQRSLEFIHNRMWHEARLTVTCTHGKARLNAYLDDYAFLMDAIIHQLCCRWSSKWLKFAMQLADTLLEQFFDAESGGFFFTSHDHETLLQRRKDFTDESLPSGNGVAALALLTLSHLTGRQDYLQAAERTLKCGWDKLEQMPLACPAMLQALRAYNQPKTIIILRGQQENILDWQSQLEPMLDAHTLLFAIPIAEQGLPPLLSEKTTDQPAAAFICSGFQCQAPLSNLAELQRALE